MSSKLHVKKDDTVLIISGDERGNTGKVIEVSPKEGKVIVEGRNKVKKHVKPRKMGDPAASLRPRAPCTCPKSRSFAPACKKADRVGHKKLCRRFQTAYLQTLRRNAVRRENSSWPE